LLDAACLPLSSFLFFSFFSFLFVDEDDCSLQLDVEDEDEDEDECEYEDEGENDVDNMCVVKAVVISDFFLSEIFDYVVYYLPVGHFYVFLHHP
jgi:hypothetical protein